MEDKYFKPTKLTFWQSFAGFPAMSPRIKELLLLYQYKQKMVVFYVMVPLMQPLDVLTLLYL